eukprot:6119644-Prymnesium_polylepis.1
MSRPRGTLMPPCYPTVWCTLCTWTRPYNRREPRPSKHCRYGSRCPLMVWRPQSLRLCSCSGATARSRRR